MLIEHQPIRLIHQVTDVIDFDRGDNDDLRLHRRTTTTQCLTQQQTFPSKPAATQQQQQPPSKDKRRRRRRVHFDDSLNETRIQAPLTAGERHAYWYRRNEIKRFRSLTAAQGKRAAASLASSFPYVSFLAILEGMMQEGQATTSTTTTTTLTFHRRKQWHQDSCSSLSFSSDEESIATSSVTLSDEDDSHSNTIIKSRHERAYQRAIQQEPELWGMERFVLDSVKKGSTGNNKKHRRRRQEQQLARMQELQRLSSTAQEKEDERVRRSCQSASQASRLFAQRVAQLQAQTL